MANTVNDVMNVIASPDYGIKNIAGTNQEILAILSGTHNSQNNIHNIVNDVKNLLQKLVDVATTNNKPVEISGNSTKINHKHIKDILNETKGIRKAIDKLSIQLGKHSGGNPTVAKLTSKASEKVAKAMIKNIEKEKSGGLSAMVDAFTKLKNISLKDILFGKMKLKALKKIFGEVKDDLKIKEKDVESIIKLVNAAPEMIKALYKVSWKINRVIKSDVIKKLSDILVGEISILSLSKLLRKNEKAYNAAMKVAKDIKELVSALNKTLWKLILTSLLSKAAGFGIKNLEDIIEKLEPLAKKLTKSKKTFENGSKAAKQMTSLVGNLLITSIFLTIAVVTGKPAALGAKFLDGMIEKIIPAAKKLVKNDKHIDKAINPALALVALTGLMAVSSIFLATIAVTGIPALLGSIFLLGIIKLNIIAFKTLAKAKKSILKGAVSMLIMSVSLILFGVALGKIANATKGMTWKQFGMIAAITGLFSVVMAALGALWFLILPGAGVMLAMGLALLPFAAALEKISKISNNLNFKQIKEIGKSMWPLAWGIAKLSVLLLPVIFGSITLGIMSLTLQKYVKTLKEIKEMGTMPTKLVYQVLNAMKAIGQFFRSNMLRPRAVKSAKMYKKMLRPFGNTLKYLNKLKTFGSVPMKLVYQTLNAMSAIGNYYKDNPIEKEVIKQAKKYKKMLRPFGNTLRHLNELKKMGEIPMKLVYGTLNAMSTISNYYIENPIRKKVIKQAKRYKKMLVPFGQTIKRLSKLKDMGIIPMKLVYGALNAISAIAEFYKDKRLSYLEGSKTKVRAIMVANIISSFGKAVKHFISLKEIRGISAELVKRTIDNISGVVSFYSNSVFTNLDDIDRKSEFTKIVVQKFAYMAKELQDVFTDLKRIDRFAVVSIVRSFNDILRFYKGTKFHMSRKKIERINDALYLFGDTAYYLKFTSEGFTFENYKNVKNMVKAMRRVMTFLKFSSLNAIERSKAKKNISLLSNMSSVMTNLSNINPSNISSIGGALTEALSGVNGVDITQMEAVTNMFNAFNGINKTESVIHKFTESVKEFTTACKELMSAMGENTDAINNMDSNGVSDVYTNTISENIVDGGSDTNTRQTGGIRIANVDELSKAIAEKINGALSVDVPDAQIQLLINGTGGNEWTISRY